MPVVRPGHRQGETAGLSARQVLRDLQAARGAPLRVRPAVWLAATLVVAIDVFTKQWALSALEPGVRHFIVGDVLSLQLVFNSGAAFSLGEGYTCCLLYTSPSPRDGLLS